MPKKLPYMPLYIGDLEKDLGVQSLSLEEYGAWMKILPRMWESEERGKLLLGGEPVDNETLATIIRVPVEKITSIVNVLLKRGVASRCPETGALMNRRMVRDEESRKQAQLDGKAGGNPMLTDGYNKPGFLYLIYNETNDTYKVGISVNPRHRLYKIRHQHKDQELDLIEVIPVDDMGEAEKAFHAQFEKYRHGEWLKIPERDRKTFLDTFTLKGKPKGSLNPTPYPNPWIDPLPLPHREDGREDEGRFQKEWGENTPVTKNQGLNTSTLKATLNPDPLIYPYPALKYEIEDEIGLGRSNETPQNLEREKNFKKEKEENSLSQEGVQGEIPAPTKPSRRKENDRAPSKLTGQQRYRFDVFKAEYPRKEGWKDAEDAWYVLNPSAELYRTIVAAVKTAKKTARWQEQAGRFIPLPATYIRGARWQDQHEVDFQSPEQKTEYLLYEQNRKDLEKKQQDAIKEEWEAEKKKLGFTTDQQLMDHKRKKLLGSANVKSVPKISPDENS